MPKKVLSLGTDGKLVLRLPDGRTEVVPKAEPIYQRALLLIDSSGSMAGNKLEQAQSGAVRFAVDALDKGYLIGLIQFGNSAIRLCESTRDVSSLRRHIQNLTADGGTNMTAAMQLAVEELTGVNGMRAIVVVTDGMPDNPATVLSVAQRAKESGIEIIAIGTDDADRDFLNKLASRSDLMIKVSRELLGESIASAAKMLPSPSR
ncbi:MAG: vWA domain-containing protein [Limisphaerales bacterium]